MHWAFATTFFFSLSAIFARRSSQALGATRANLGRVGLAALILGAYAHGWGHGFDGAGAWIFFLSGVVGVGLGDLGLFAALPLIGSRLSILLMQCLAAPIAIGAEWVFLDTHLGGRQLAVCAVILGGLMLALLPGKNDPPRVRVRPIGFLYALIAAAGQGLGAVISRQAVALNAGAGHTIDGFTAGYQRVLGGLACTLLALALTTFWQKSRAAGTTTSDAVAPSRSLASYRWVPLNALCGPVLGIGFYQLALTTTPSGLVLSIVACTPIVIIPLAYFFENERPSLRSLLGGAIAVAGAVALIGVA